MIYCKRRFFFNSRDRKVLYSDDRGTVIHSIEALENIFSYLLLKKKKGFTFVESDVLIHGGVKEIDNIIILKALMKGLSVAVVYDLSSKSKYTRDMNELLKIEEINKVLYRAVFGDTFFNAKKIESEIKGYLNNSRFQLIFCNVNDQDRITLFSNEKISGRYYYAASHIFTEEKTVYPSKVTDKFWLTKDIFNHKNVIVKNFCPAREVINPTNYSHGILTNSFLSSLPLSAGVENFVPLLSFGGAKDIPSIKANLIEGIVCLKGKIHEKLS